MRIDQSSYTISEIADMFTRKDIVVNQQYQREGRLWPDYAKSYFIDTILEKYPFPKIYLYQTIKPGTIKPVKEIVDGQQRVLTILDFLSNKFALTSSSKRFQGFKFSDLEDQDKQDFLLYSVNADVILAVERFQLLEMFRRMNAYTLPLNSQEKRNSIYQGELKWLINELADKYSEFFEKFGVFTARQVLRMVDQEFIAELILVLDQGIKSKSEKDFETLYKKYNEANANLRRYGEMIDEVFLEIQTNFADVKNSLICKPYAVYSILCSFIHLKYGIQNGERDLGIAPINMFYRDHDRALHGLLELSASHELKDVTGNNSIYVNAATSTTTKYNQRCDRAKEIIKYLI